ncbi:unnamed protein product [Closterium sp. Naga37s-1]|nr:unnamed protein product [Closterium sp. Naga37s-1]
MLSSSPIFSTPSPRSYHSPSSYPPAFSIAAGDERVWVQPHSATVSQAPFTSLPPALPPSPSPLSPLPPLYPSPAPPFPSFPFPVSPLGLLPVVAWLQEKSACGCSHALPLPQLATQRLHHLLPALPARALIAEAGNGRTSAEQHTRALLLPLTARLAAAGVAAAAAGGEAEAAVRHGLWGCLLAHWHTLQHLARVLPDPATLPLSTGLLFHLLSHACLCAMPRSSLLFLFQPAAHRPSQHVGVVQHLFPIPHVHVSACCPSPMPCHAMPRAAPPVSSSRLVPA